jgi:cell division protein FtsQ
MTATGPVTPTPGPGIRDATRVLSSRRRARLHRRLKLAGIALGVILLAGLAVWLVGFSSVFAASRIEVRGNSQVTAAEVQAAAAVPLGTPLIRLDTAAIAARVEALPPVAAAEITRHLDGAVEIAVTERTALYALRVDGAYHLVDAGGFDYLTVAEAPEGLLQATVAAGQDRLLADAATAVAALTPALREQITSMNVTSPDHIEFALASGATLLWGSAEDSDLKAVAAEALVLNVAAAYYDVSAPAYPATRPW